MRYEFLGARRKYEEGIKTLERLKDIEWFECICGEAEKRFEQKVKEVETLIFTSDSPYGKYKMVDKAISSDNIYLKDEYRENAKEYLNALKDIKHFLPLEKSGKGSIMLL